MPVQLWGTFSVADHIDTRALVADVLLYDRLIIPCPPPDDKEYERWCKKGWKPKTQARILRKIAGLYEPVFWTDEHQKGFHAFLGATHKNPAPHTDDVANRARMELFALQSTREWLRKQTGRMLFEEADKLPEGLAAQDISVVSAYRSCGAFNSECVISALPPPGRPTPADRETELYHVIARKLVVPPDDDPEIALDRAVSLAKCDDYIRHRRRLYEYVDQRIAGKATPEADRIAVEDAFAEMSRLARKTFNGGLEEVAVTCGKVMLGGAQAVLGDPTGLAAGTLEALGYATRREISNPIFGPYAMLHDVLNGMHWQKLGFAEDACFA
jgi:hypothetical protein